MKELDKVIDEVLIKYGCLNKTRVGSLSTLQGALSQAIERLIDRRPRKEAKKVFLKRKGQAEWVVATILEENGGCGS